MTLTYSGMILAAGFGKRMMPLTRSIPKPLIEINGLKLLDNSINFLKRLSCKEIIINTHYHHKKIEKVIASRSDKKNIKLIYEDRLLDTGGAVKNATPYFSNNNAIIINSDIYWQDKNLIDAKKLIKDFYKHNKTHLLLVGSSKAFGHKKKTGEFILKDLKIYRYRKGDDIFFYSGLQMLNLDIFKNFNEKKFSFNLVWDYLIKKQILYGKVMNSNWYHVGDIKGLEIVKKLES